MNHLHSGILEISLQQQNAGKLPSGLLKEIKESEELAKKWMSDFSIEQVLKIDRQVLRDSSYYPEEAVLSAMKLGLYTQWLPKALGGGGFHPLSMYGFNFEMGGRCLGISNLVGAHYVGIGLVSASNAFAVLEKIIADIHLAQASGKHCVVSAAITEPSAGSDLEDSELIQRAKVGTLAKKVEGGYLLSGQKIFISNSAFASWHIVSAFEDLEKPGDSVIILAVPAQSKGVSVGKSERKMGQGASPASVLFFDQVFVPDEFVCFSKAQFQSAEEYSIAADCLLNDILALSRAGVGCMSAGAIKQVLEIIIPYIESASFGSEKQSLADQEWVQAIVGQILQNFIAAKTISWEAQIEGFSRGPYKDLQKPAVFNLFKFLPSFFLKMTLGKWMTSVSGKKQLQEQRIAGLASLETAVASRGNEKMISGWGSVAKASCSDLCMHSVQAALNMVSSKDHQVFMQLEKILRDVKLLQIYEGTNDLNRLMIFKNFAGPAGKDRLVFLEAP